MGTKQICWLCGEEFTKTERRHPFFVMPKCKKCKLYEKLENQEMIKDYVFYRDKKLKQELGISEEKDG